MTFTVVLTITDSLACFSDSLVFGFSVIVALGHLIISSCFGCCFIAKSFHFVFSAVVVVLMLNMANVS